jgi:ferredoxin-type protein NapF
MEAETDRTGVRWMIRLRGLTRCGMLVLCCLLLLTGTATIWPVVISGASPLVALASLLVTRTFPWHGWIALGVLLLVVWRQRWFCHWICPMGFCADRATWLGGRLGRQRGRWPAVGQWIAVLTLAGACVGYPLLLWLDPLALLSAAMVPWRSQAGLRAWWSVSGIVAVLVFSLIWPHLWCARLCPLGGLQDTVHGLRRLAHAALYRNARHPPAPLVASAGLRRRTILGAIFGVVWATTTLKIRAKSLAPRRPPGAIDESRFTGLCMRCGNCSRACPTAIITHDQGESGLAGLLTPRIDFHHGYCLEDCNQCTLVCPSGAIEPVPLDRKISARIGTPVVNMDLCLLGADRECSICRNRCPFEAIQLVFSEETYTLTPQVDLQRCPGCGACQVACPTSPEKAIVVCV